MAERRLASYVNLEVMTAAGFNYWEPCIMFDAKNRDNTAYISYQPDDKLNICIIESKHTQSLRKEWFVGTYTGREEIGSEELIQLQNLVARRNRIAGSNLEAWVRSRPLS